MYSYVFKYTYRRILTYGKYGLYFMYYSRAAAYIKDISVASFFPPNGLSYAVSTHFHISAYDSRKEKNRCKLQHQKRPCV